MICTTLWHIHASSRAKVYQRNINDNSVWPCAMYKVSYPGLAHFHVVPSQLNTQAVISYRNEPLFKAWGASHPLIPKISSKYPSELSIPPNVNPYHSDQIYTLCQRFLNCVSNHPDNLHYVVPMLGQPCHVYIEPTTARWQGNHPLEALAMET